MKKKIFAGAVWLRSVGTAAMCGGSREVTACLTTINQKGGNAIL